MPDSTGRSPPFLLIDTTLREGEQFATSCFSTRMKLALARALDAFGIDYIEVTSPAASPRSFLDARKLASMGLRARVLAHVRCHEEDVRAALDAGVGGVGLLYAVSDPLRRNSHGRTLAQILDAMASPIALAKRAGVEVRFSAEDSFRSEPADVLRLLCAAEEMGVDRLGLADTVGIATPRQVYELTRRVRAATHRPLGFHGHDDTGCAVANAWSAVEAGATHVDVSILGLGERIGITPLGAFTARALSLVPETARRYRLSMLHELERLAARAAGVVPPFNRPLTAPTAFAHKAGLHLKAVLRDPGAYEIFAPELAGNARRLVLGSKLTGRHALGHRARTIGLSLSEEELRAATRRVKALADRSETESELSERELDEALRGPATAT